MKQGWFGSSTAGRVVVVAVALMMSRVSPGQKPDPKPTEPQASVSPAPESQPTSGEHELTAADLEAFLDGVMPLQLGREDIAGAVISVVKDGKVLFAKGYGYSDVEKKIRVSPETTLFRPGSISKTFTWTALMQQVEQGKVNLDHDVNDYIDFKIPPAFGKPITVRNLMTHTPGLDESVEELFVDDAKHLYPIGNYLKEHLPARIYEPGTIPAYSNYGATLAGYIVERVSGEPFDQYTDEHIFQPLGMEHSTFRQPLPKALEPMMSKGYSAASEPAKPFEFVESTPAGSSSVTAMDMTHFMIAHLQNGQYEGTQILKPETAQQMHARQFALRPEINGMALGFYEESRNGQRIIGHGGDTELFHSDMHLMLDKNVGFFISYNSAGKGEISPREAIWHQFLDRYFPYQPPAGQKPATADQDASAVTGHYISSRRSEKTILKVIGVAGQAQVSVNPDGTISVSDLKDLNGKPKKLSEIGPMLFRDVNGQDHAAFVQAGGYEVLSFDFPPIVLLKASGNENGALQLPLLIGSLSIFLLALIFWPLAAMIRRHYGRSLGLSSGERRLRFWVRIVCLLNLLFVLSFLVFFSVGLKDIGIFSPRYDPLLRCIQLLGWLGVLGTLIAVYNMMVSWAGQQRWFWSKVSETIIALSCIGFCWFVFTWNLLSWSLRY
jgi:CubicO group peptidase (beta-lactamase class C family)